MNSQSTRSVTPPWPGISESKSFTSYARLIADARKPPNGATTDANNPKTTAWSWIGLTSCNVTKPSFISLCVRNTAAGSHASGSWKRNVRDVAGQLSHLLLANRGAV